jgi:hypothetical protein
MNGRPVSGGALFLAHGDGLFGLDGRGVQIRSTGAFVTPALFPGTYFLRFHDGISPTNPESLFQVSGAKVVVAGADVANVRVMPISMVKATGRLVVSEADRPALQVSTMTVGATPIDFDGDPGPQRPGVPNEDLSFEFRTWPSVGTVRVSPESEWIIKSVHISGVGVPDQRITFHQGKDISNLEVEIVRLPARGR